MRVFPHNRLEKLESHLRWANAPAAGRTPRLCAGSACPGRVRRVTAWTETGPPCPEIVELKRIVSGAWLLVDEAHAVGSG